jgi:hypothetical protein
MVVFSEKDAPTLINSYGFGKNEYKTKEIESIFE